jgi:Flp pilus assembly protein TadD
MRSSDCFLFRDFRAIALVVKLSRVLLAASLFWTHSAWAQQRRVRPPRPDPTAQTLAICESSAPQDCLRAIQRLSPNRRALAPVVRARFEARFAVISPALEPDAARVLPSAQQVELQQLSRDLSAWTDAHRDDGALWLLRGRLSMVLNQLDSAAVALQQAAQTLPSDPQVFNDQAMVLVALRRLPDAERALMTATRLAPADAVPWSNLGAVRLARGQAALAVEAFREATRASPNTAQYHSDLGAALLAASQPEPAVLAFGEAVRRSPSDPILRANLGYALTTIHRFDDAYAELQRATQLGPRCSAAWNNLATVLVHRGDRVGAIAALQRALSVDPTDSRARANLEALAPTDAGAASSASDATADSGRH